MKKYPRGGESTNQLERQKSFDEEKAPHREEEELTIRRR